VKDTENRDDEAPEAVAEEAGEQPVEEQPTEPAEQDEAGPERADEAADLDHRVGSSHNMKCDPKTQSSKCQPPP